MWAATLKTAAQHNCCGSARKPVKSEISRDTTPATRYAGRLSGITSQLAFSLAQPNLINFSARC